jgi:hypothetical protein
MNKKFAHVITTLLTLSAAIPASSQESNIGTLRTKHILFVGDSFTHGRYLPVRTYHNTPGTGGVGSTEPSPLVVDENFDTSIIGRMEDTPGEEGPWGGIPGIFAELAHEAQLPYDVHIEAISATTLTKNYSLAKDVITRPLWDAVVLQETSFEPIPSSLTKDDASNPQEFCNAVQNIERGVHSAIPLADIYLYSTWAPADTAYLDATADGASFSSGKFLESLDVLTAAYRDAYLSAAAQDRHIRGIAPVGDAWALAWRTGVANPNPYSGITSGISLSFNYQPDSEPSTTDVPTDAGFHHPSKYGAYLNGLVLFQTVTGVDVRMFGKSEQTARDLDIPADLAVALQRTAWQSVVLRDYRPNSLNSSACSPNH